MAKTLHCDFKKSTFKWYVSILFVKLWCQSVHLHHNTSGTGLFNTEQWETVQSVQRCSSLSGQQTGEANRELKEKNKESSNNHFPQSLYQKKWNLISILWSWHCVCVCVCVCTDSLPFAVHSVPQVSPSTHISSLSAHPPDSFPPNTVLIYFLLLFAECVKTFQSHQWQGQMFLHITSDYQIRLLQ